MHLFATTTAEQVLELGKLAAIVEVEPKASSENRQRAPQPTLKSAWPGTLDPAAAREQFNQNRQSLI